MAKNISDHDEAVLGSIFTPDLPYSDRVEVKKNEVLEVETELVKQCKELEVKGVKAAEEGDVLSALDFFSQSIHLGPERPSGYNNRAQALRLKNDVDGALDDLNRAVELSGGEGQAACQAYTQRALIKRLEGDEAGSLEDFRSAAALGSEFAKHQCALLNPYAAMCNQMLAEVIGKIRRGEPDD